MIQNRVVTSPIRRYFTIKLSSLQGYRSGSSLHNTATVVSPYISHISQVFTYSFFLSNKYGVVLLNGLKNFVYADYTIHCRYYKALAREGVSGGYTSSPEG